MWRNYLTATLRHIARNPLTTLLNIAGLALGFTVALLVLLYVNHETTFDRFLPNNESIYVVVPHQTMQGQGTMIGDQSSAWLAGWLRSDFPELQTSRLMPAPLTVRRGEVEAEEQTGWADPNFFSMLGMTSVAGDLRLALSRPDQLVLTRRMARKYFGYDNVLGRTLEIGKQSFQIAAVIDDLPAATHLVPEIYGSALNRELGMQRFDEVPWPENGRTPVVTYVRAPVDSRASIARVQAAMPAFVQRHMRRLFEVLQSKFSIDMQLVPLARLHLYPNDGDAMKSHGKPTVVAAAGIAGFLMLLAAITNFVNLTTAQSARRALEVGVRKVAGARRSELMSQFLGESLLYAFLAMAFAIALVIAALPAVDARLAPGIAEQWWTMRTAASVAGIVTVAGVLGGLYPALVLSTYRPANVLKGNVHVAGSARGRQYLVALQFSVLIVLVVATLVILRQTAYVLRDGLRFPQDQLLIVRGACPTAFTEQMRTLPGVSGTACASSPNFAPRSVTLAKSVDGTQISLNTVGTGFGLFELFGIHPLAGRLYDPGRDMAATEDDRAPLAVLNEAAVRALGFDSPAAAAGQSVVSIQNQGGPPTRIIGVVPDFTFDLQGTRVGPVLYSIQARFGPGAVLNVKLTGSDVPETLEAIDALWKRTGEPRPIRRLFMDQLLQEQYVATIHQAYIVGILAVLAIVIAALGLFGLSTMTAEQRTREIGIRKAMGASRRDILGLLLWQFTRPVLWASLIAWPVAWFAMRRWLQGFGYHIDLQLWMFLTASALAVAIALLTVMGHALLVSRARPVAALRYE